MKRRTSTIIIIIALVGLIGIVAAERGRHFWNQVVAPAVAPAESNKPDTVPAEASDWESYGRGVARREYWFKNSTQGRLILYRFDQLDFKARLVQRAPGLTVREWLSADAKDTLVVNGVYFDERDLPVGYTMIDGNRIGKGIVSGKTITAVSLSPRVSFGANRSSIRDGFETYPVLMKSGKAAVVTDSKLYARRTLVGMDETGMIFVGVIPDSSVSLYELAKTLEGLDIKWTMVANLDGGPSTGIAARFGDHEEHFDSLTTIPNVLVIERR